MDENQNQTIEINESQAVTEEQTDGAKKEQVNDDSPAAPEQEQNIAGLDEADIETAGDVNTTPDVNQYDPLLSSLNAILTALKYTNPIIYDKVLNTGNNAVKLFDLLGYEITPELQLVSYMANYGLLAIPENILFRQGYLDNKEFDEIKKHVILSAKIAQDLYLSSYADSINSYVESSESEEQKENIISSYNQTAEWIYKVIGEHHELPIGNPVAKGYFNKLSILRESYLVGIADKITGYTDKTRRFYGVVLPPDVAVDEVLSVFDNSTGIFAKEELNGIKEFLIANISR